MRLLHRQVVPLNVFTTHPGPTCPCCKAFLIPAGGGLLAYVGCASDGLLACVGCGRRYTAEVWEQVAEHRAKNGPRWAIDKREEDEMANEDYMYVGWNVALQEAAKGRRVEYKRLDNNWHCMGNDPMWNSSTILNGFKDYEFRVIRQRGRCAEHVDEKADGTYTEVARRFATQEAQGSVKDALQMVKRKAGGSTLDTRGLHKLLDEVERIFVGDE